MSLLTASLFLICLAFLFASALYIYSLSPFDRLNTSYAFLSLSLMGWMGTLFVFASQGPGSTLLFIGRANFAAAAIAAPAGLVFVQALRNERPLIPRWLWIEIGIMFALSLFTPLVDRSEAVQAGIHTTAYGLLFAPYVLHEVAFLAAAVTHAFRKPLRLFGKVRQQLILVGAGILATAIVSVYANAVLPYVYGNFHLIYWGSLSSIFFLAAVAYAAVSRDLFDARLVLRKTVIYGLLIAFAVSMYEVAVESLAGLLPVGDPGTQHVAAAAIALTINAFSHEPLQRILEQLADKLTHQSEAKKHSRIVHR